MLYALDKIREEAKDYYNESTGEYYKYWHDFAAENLYGIEVNEKIARGAKMNMIIHDDGHTNVIGCDSLEGSIPRSPSPESNSSGGGFSLKVENNEMISKQALDKLREIYKEEKGLEPSNEALMAEAASLLVLFDAIYKPIKKTWLKDYQRSQNLSKKRKLRRGN